MNKEEVKLLENTELIFYFLISRDNLLNIKRQLQVNKNDDDLKTIFDEEQKNYNALLNEVYRRMRKWVKV